MYDIIKSLSFILFKVGMPTPESASAAAYGSQPGGMPYGTAPPGGAPGQLAFGVSFKF